MRCAVCPGNYKCLQGDGPQPARYALIGERPGQNEERIGRVFIGDAGKEQDKLYLPLAGINRDECYVTNSVKCGSDRNKKPTDKELEICSAHFLPEELRVTDPEIVFLLGATACKLIPEIDLETQHGIPFRGELFGKTYWICPMYHPAAGLHNTNLMIPLMDDWRRFKTWDGEDWEEFQETDFRVAETEKDVDKYFSDYEYSRYDTFPYIGGDSESHDGEPYSLQVSIQVNTGLMVLERHRHIMHRLAAAMSFHLATAELVLHNAPADLEQFQKLMGPQGFNYRDTMQEAYQFQNLPQKLKALAYRLLHKRRRSWDEVVTPYSKDVLREWMIDAILESEKAAVVIPKFHKKTGKPCKPEIIKDLMESKLRGILTHMSGSETYNPWERLTPEMESRFGYYPRKGIAYVPIDEAAKYACADASDTLELAMLFDIMRQSNEFKVHEQDEDKTSQLAV